MQTLKADHGRTSSEQLRLLTEQTSKAKQCEDQIRDLESQLDEARAAAEDMRVKTEKVSFSGQSIGTGLTRNPGRISLDRCHHIERGHTIGT